MKKTYIAPAIEATTLGSHDNFLLAASSIINININYEDELDDDDEIG